MEGKGSLETVAGDCPGHWFCERWQEWEAEMRVRLWSGLRSSVRPTLVSVLAEGGVCGEDAIGHQCSL